MTDLNTKSTSYNYTADKADKAKNFLYQSAYHAFYTQYQN